MKTTERAQFTFSNLRIEHLIIETAKDVSRVTEKICQKCTDYHEHEDY